ncbi:MAG TPA: M20/M25/M40 family metallo-hydrolase [Longimicrobiales bacterium]|nr:M20/M25/M40 family metallo-hydrolase [Longimicrobiales bacterium]
MSFPGAAVRCARRAACPAAITAALLLFPMAPLNAQDRAVRSALAGVDAERIRAHVTFLSSDLLEGRGVGTRGGALAIEYIAAQFAHSGLQPLHGSWYQPVPLAGWRADTARTRITVGSGDDALRLRAVDGVLLWPAAGAAQVSHRDELVFVGYGVRAPEYSWDDYKVDVRGRIVVVLAGDPPAPPGSSDFEGDALTYYGRWTYKIEEAGRQGAGGVLLVHAPELAGYEWNVVQRGWGGEVLSLREDSSVALPRLTGWLRRDAAQRLLAAAGLDYDQLFVAAARRDFQPVTATKEVRVQATGELRAITTTNVAGLLPGRHPQRRSEVVIYTAHHDALGLGSAVGDDDIYNGAYDNAGGVALLLEVAETFAALPAPPERSVLFLATAAEEAGMLGATHYTRHPLVPIVRTVALINLEGANFWGETDDVSGVGLERSTLGLELQRTATLLGLRTTAERAPAQGFFYRSDQLPFARLGVPAIALDHGLSFRGRPPGWGVATLSAFLDRSYHAPSDELPANADMRGAAQQARVAFLLGHGVASHSGTPRNYPDVAPLPPPARPRAVPETARPETR